MRTLDTDIVMEPAVCTYFSLALEQSVEILRRSTEHRRRRRLCFDRQQALHNRTEPNRTKSCWHGNLRWANSARFRSVWLAFTQRSETEPNRAVLCWHSYKCSCECGSSETTPRPFVKGDGVAMLLCMSCH